MPRQCGCSEPMARGYARRAGSGAGDDPHLAGRGVDLDEVAVVHLVEQPGDADHGGDAVLAGEDRGVAERAPFGGGDRGDQGERGVERGGGGDRHEHVAGLEVAEVAGGREHAGPALRGLGADADAAQPSGLGSPAGAPVEVAGGGQAGDGRRERLGRAPGRAPARRAGTAAAAPRRPAGGRCARPARRRRRVRRRRGGRRSRRARPRRGRRPAAGRREPEPAAGFEHALAAADPWARCR